MVSIEIFVIKCNWLHGRYLAANLLLAFLTQIEIRDQFQAKLRVTIRDDLRVSPNAVCNFICQKALYYITGFMLLLMLSPEVKKLTDFEFLPNDRPIKIH
jgi:hypothetical protein